MRFIVKVDVKPVKWEAFGVEAMTGDVDPDIASYDRVVKEAREDAERVRMEMEMSEALAGAWKICATLGGRTTATEVASAMMRAANLKRFVELTNPAPGKPVPAPDKTPRNLVICPESLYGECRIKLCHEWTAHEPGKSCKIGVTRPCAMLRLRKPCVRLVPVAVGVPVESARVSPPAWVSVKEGLPVWVKGMRWMVTDGKVAYVTSERPVNWITSGCEGIIGAVVTHWMPMGVA